MGRLAGRAERLGRRAAEARGATRYDAWQNREARAARAVIEAQDPNRAPGAATLRRIRDYAGDALGSPRFAPWLETYAAWRGAFHEGWIPDNYFGRVVLPTLPGARRGLDPKTLARRLLLGTDLLPDRASYVNGAWLDADGEPTTEAAALEAIFAEGDRAVVKFDGAGRGLGVSIVRRGELRAADLAGRGDFVVQAYIRQSAFFDAFCPAAVATLRLTTYKGAGAPAGLRAAYLRLGRADTDIVVASRSIRVAVEGADGALAPEGALEDWTRVAAHPDSGAPFAGAAIPGYAEAVERVLALHERLPHVARIGWDVTMGEDGRLRLMEFNPNHADIKFSEAATGPHYRDLNWERLARTPG